MTIATVLLLAAFIALGRWQWQRGADKESVWAEYQRVAPPAELDARNLDRVARFAHVALRGSYDAGHQFLLDNRAHDGMPGYEVLTPLLLADGTRLLVNRGWVPFSGYRDRLPDIRMAADPGMRAVAGRIEELPSAGLASGRAPPSTDALWPKLTSFPTHEQLEHAYGAQLGRRVLLLDAGEPHGYVREWTPPGMPPSRHYSYAIQWWGFGLVLLVLYFGLNFRKVA